MNLIERLKAKIAKLNSRHNEVFDDLLKEADNEKRAALGETLKALKEDIEEAEAMLKEAEEQEGDGNGETAPAATEGRNAGFKPMATYGQRAAAPAADDITSTTEYRKAFQKYMATGDKTAIRAVTKTTDTNVSTVIPQNLADKILEKIEQLGVVLNLVTKTSYPVGQSIPVDGVKPVATWVGKATSNSGEGAGSTAQNKTLGAQIVFAHYKLRCEIRMTEEVSVMALPAFEALFVKQVSEAMVRAKEFAVVEGDGVGMPTGILNYTAPAGQAVTIAAAASLDYKALCNIEALVPAQYENTAKWLMTKKTFMSFVGMMDSNKQPVARVNYGISGKPERFLLGREVVIYAPQENSKLKSYADTVSADSIVACIFDFADYVLNENYNLGIQHAIDWDNEDHKTKAVLACDGRAVSIDSLVTVTKTKA